MAAVGFHQILEKVSSLNNQIVLRSRCCLIPVLRADEGLFSVWPAAAAHCTLTVLHLNKSIQAWTREEMRAGISSTGNEWYVSETGRLVHAKSQARRFPSPAIAEFWQIAAEPRPLNQTWDPSLRKTLGKRRCVSISHRLWHTPHFFLRKRLFYQRQLYGSITAVQV